MNYSRLLNNVSGLQLFQLLRFGSFLFTAILLAKGGIELQVIGAYESLMFVSGALSFFWVNALLNSLLASYPSHHEKKKYLFSVAVLVMLCSVVIFLFLHIAKPLLFSLFAENAIPYFTLFSFFLLLNNPCYLIEYIYLANEKPKDLLRYGLVSFTLTIAVVVLPLYLGYDLSVSLQGLIAVSIFKLIWLCKLLLEYGEIKLRGNYLKQHFKLALPLLFSFLISGSADYIDGLMVTHFFGAQWFAIFRYGAKEFPFSLLLANALSVALLPVLSAADQMQQGMDRLKEKSKNLMHFLFPVSIVLLLTSQWFYPLVFNKNFIASAAVFNVYILLVISRLVFPQTIVMALKETKAILVISIAEIAVNVVCSYLLMLRFGIMGIAYGTLIAFAVEKALLMLYLFLIKKINPSKYIPIKTWTVYCILLILCYCIIHQL